MSSLFRKRSLRISFFSLVIWRYIGNSCAIRARRFRSERQRHSSRRRRPTGRQDSYRRRFYHALAQRRSGGHAQPHCPAEPGRHARHRLQPERERYCLCNRGAGGRQDFGGRRFQPSIGGQTRNHIARLDATTGLADSFDPNANSTVFAIAVQADGKILAGGFFTTASADRRATASPGSIPRPAWLIRSTRTRTVLSVQSRCRRTARF